MTPADLQQIIDDAANADSWARFAGTVQIGRMIIDADKAQALARIALAAVEVSRLKSALSSAATQGSEAFIDASIALGKAETAMNDALRDAGLIE